MAKAKPSGPAVLTANDLLSGVIVYWTGSTWSRRLDEATRANDPDGRAALERQGAASEAANEIVGPYLVVLDATGTTPVALRERQRHAGPLSMLSAA